MMKCPCDSGKSYEQCCKTLHEGAAAENALDLMRSRFSAYALHDVQYIIETTHPDNAVFEKDKAQWIKEIIDFSYNTNFRRLDILDFHEENEDVAYVTFVAYLSSGGHDTTFTEKSRFEKIDGRWKYQSGSAIKGKYQQNS